ncbi:hypothetical protein [Pasteurella multocida]|nr:hypothetical protein [Pasteurella multocida]
MSNLLNTNAIYRKYTDIAIMIAIGLPILLMVISSSLLHYLP